MVRRLILRKTVKGVPSQIRGKNFTSGLWTVTSHLRITKDFPLAKSIQVWLEFESYMFPHCRVSRTLNHAVSRVVTPIVVHAVHRVLIGYLSRTYSAIFCCALFRSTHVSLAILCTFLRVAIIVFFFSSKGV